jgi:hypothetical protein
MMPARKQKPSSTPLWMAFAVSLYGSSSHNVRYWH